MSPYLLVLLIGASSELAIVRAKIDGRNGLLWSPSRCFSPMMMLFQLGSWSLHFVASSSSRVVIFLRVVFCLAGVWSRWILYNVYFRECDCFVVFKFGLYGAGVSKTCWSPCSIMAMVARTEWEVALPGLWNIANITKAVCGCVWCAGSSGAFVMSRLVVGSSSGFVVGFSGSRSIVVSSSGCRVQLAGWVDASHFNWRWSRGWPNLVVSK